MSEANNDEANNDEANNDEANNDELGLDPAEAEARLDELGENIQQARRDAEEHGTLGAAADDDEQRFVEDGDDDEMNTQGIAPPA